MEERQGRANQVLGEAAGSSGEILCLVNQRWPFPRELSGDDEVLSFPVTQEP